MTAITIYLFILLMRNLRLENIEFLTKTSIIIRLLFLNRKMLKRDFKTRTGLNWQMVDPKTNMILV